MAFLMEPRKWAPLAKRNLIQAAIKKGRRASGGLLRN
jgi:hypothetical protein